MESLNTALTTAVTPSALFGAIEDVLPFVGVLIIFGFSYYILRKVVRGARTGKAKI